MSLLSMSCKDCVEQTVLNESEGLTQVYQYLNDFSLDFLEFILSKSLSKLFFIMFSIMSQNDIGKLGDCSIIVIFLNP